METSGIIKFNQVHPPSILLERDDAWKVEGRTCYNCGAPDEDACDCGQYKARFYWVTRSPRERERFWCGCRAGKTNKLCRHVQAALLHLAGKVGAVQVSFWTTLDDAQRQHRRWAQYTTKSRDFWVTYNWPTDVPRTGDRIVKVKQDAHRDGIADAYYRASDGGWYRRVVRRAA